MNTYPNTGSGWTCLDGWYTDEVVDEELRIVPSDIFMHAGKIVVLLFQFWYGMVKYQVYNHTMEATTSTRFHSAFRKSLSQDLTIENKSLETTTGTVRTIQQVSEADEVSIDGRYSPRWGEGLRQSLVQPCPASSAERYK